MGFANESYLLSEDELCQMFLGRVSVTGFLLIKQTINSIFGKYNVLVKRYYKIDL